jgi:SAM-dependent methyltransferase
MLGRLKEEAQARDLPQVQAVRMNAQRLAVRDGAFDCVLCAFALDSFPEPARAISEARRVLRAGGRFALSISNRWWFEGDERWAWLERLLVSMGAQLHDGPLRFVEPGQVRALLDRRGFGQVVVMQEDFLLVFADFDEWWRWGWSHGYRRILDALSKADLVRYKAQTATEIGRIGTIQGRIEVLLAGGTAI